MTSRTRRRFRVTLLALCCLLLAQWTLVTHACPVIQRAGEAIAQLQIEAELAAQGASDCHGAATVADQSQTGSPTCLKHCADEGSASNNGPSLAFAAPTAPPLVLRGALLASTGPLHWQRAPARGDATAPPLSILYCVFLT